MTRGGEVVYLESALFGTASPVVAAPTRGFVLVA